MHKKESDGTQRERSEKAVDRSVSLAPLALGEALTALFAIPDPDATKPKNRKKRGKLG
jgi:hypothetical protein